MEAGKTAKTSSPEIQNRAVWMVPILPRSGSGGRR
jgi:hypothetical protein